MSFDNFLKLVSDLNFNGTFSKLKETRPSFPHVADATMTSSPRGKTVAVIGLGAMGIVAVKNLAEEGFDVTGFERSPYVGGLWHYTEDRDTLSVLKDTEANVSSDRGCYTDYPFPKGTPHYCSAQGIEEYLENYVDHFDLRPRFQLNAKVTSIIHQDDKDKWRIDVDGQSSRWVDRVIMATGPHVQPVMPEIEGSHLFKGRILHSRSFKRPEEFEGKRVVVLGLGNTGGDIAHALVNHASSISISHNRGAHILPRLLDGKPASHLVTQRRINVQGFGEKYFPAAIEKAVNKKAKALMTETFGETDPAWNLEPPPSMKVTTPVVSDTLVGHLRSGAVRSVAGIRRITGPAQMELNDGTVIEADSITCCTGFQNDFRILDQRYDPSANPSQAWLNAPGANGRPLPRLYQNVFSLQKPDSLAFLGCAWFAAGAFCLADLASMSIAQTWNGNSPLPAPAEMSKWADRQAERIIALAQRGSPIPASVPHRDWLVWADQTAGSGVFERLGWGWKGWEFWWREREMWGLIMDGVLTSAVWRLFDEGKRKRWEGAREEILRWNREAEGEDK